MKLGIEVEGRLLGVKTVFIDATESLSDAQRAQVFEGNARRVYPRLDRALTARGL